MKCILILVLSISTLTQVFGQTCDLNGRVISDESDILLPKTSVSLINNKDTIHTITNYSGRYTFKNLKIGTYTLLVKNDQRYLFDSVVNISKPLTVFDIRMKTFKPHVFEKTTYYKFRYREIPTCYGRYEYIIKKDSLFLDQRKLTHCNEIKDQKRKVIKRKFSYAFKKSEQKTLDSLIKSNGSDLISSYEDRVLVWGWHWNINIERQGANFNLDLPNYHNQGLEEILEYVSGLVPKKEKFDWTR